MCVINLLPQMVVQEPSTAQDALTGKRSAATAPPLNGIQGRAGYGPPQPLLVISPFAKANFVDHGLTDQSSILRFVEDNWGTGQIGGGSFDALAGPITNMFDFSEEHESDERVLILDPNSGNGHGGGEWTQNAAGRRGARLF